MVMANESDEKMFGADLPESLIQEFMSQCEATDCKKKVALKAAVKLWIELSPEIRARLIDQSLDSNSFIELVQQIVDQRIEDGRKAAQSLVGRQKSTQGRKGRAS